MRDASTFRFLLAALKALAHSCPLQRIGVSAAAVAVAIALTPLVQAATTVSGTIATNTLWAASQAPFNVTADVTIDNGATLTVEAGVTIYMNTGASLIVNNGALAAQGTNDKPIVLTSGRDVSGASPGPAAGDWGQLRFQAGTLGAGTVLDHVVVRYGHGIGIVSASPTINRTSLVENAGPAIAIDLASSPSGSGLTATGNGLNGILVPQGDILGSIIWGLRGIPYVVAEGILSVGRSPAVASLSPASVMQGGSVAATLTGTRLDDAESASVSDPHSTASVLPGGTSTSVPIRIDAGAGAVPGATTLTVQLAAGTVSAPFTITALPLSLGVMPNPLAVPPDASPHHFNVVLSRADAGANTVNVALDDSSVAAVSPPSATIPAGQRQATFQLSGKLQGQTILRVSAPGLAAVSVPVYVTADYAGINTAYSLPLGVRVGTPVAPPPDSRIANSLPLGVSVGPLWRGMTPGMATVGSAATLTLTGAGFPADATVAISPPDGLVVGTSAVSADRTQIAVPLTVGANAPATLRRVVLTAGTLALAPAQPGADRLLITGPSPTIDWISPIVGTPGQTIATFSVHGANLHGAQALLFQGGDMAASAAPSVSGDGSLLTASVAISAAAVPGTRVVVVQTPGGSSDTTPAAANTFTIAGQPGTVHTPIVSSQLGVNVGTAAPPPAAFLDAHSPPLGVVRGPVIMSVSPATAARGESVTLLLGGRALAGVTAVTLAPAAGLTLGQPVVAADGMSLAVPLAVDAAAALGPRLISVSAGSAATPFASPRLAQFAVTAPPPQIESLSPLVLVAGADNTSLVLRGRNFQGATAVRFHPAAGIVVSAPEVSPAGDGATVTVAVDAAAALGARAVSIATPAGESPTAPSDANTVTVSTTGGTSYGALASRVLGIQVGQAVPPPTTLIDGTLASPLLGVTIGAPPTPPPASVEMSGAQLGVTVGPVAFGIAPRGLVAGTTATLAVHGALLPANTAVTLVPANGITLGAVQVSGDGSALTVSVAVDAAAALTRRALSLTNGATPIRFIPPAAETVTVTVGPPSLVSLTPILGNRGDTLSLTIRGTNLRDVTSIAAEPASGIRFSATPSVSDDGTQITLPLVIDPAAPAGARVIRVFTLGGATSSAGTAANTFSIY